MDGSNNIVAKKPLLSIIICTYDRYELLIKTLSSLNKITSIEQCEVLIVENTADANKRHETKSICGEKFPHFQVYDCEVPGLSRARNHGLLRARADIIAYLDDDATPCHDWAEAIIAAFDDHTVAYAGGPIEPEWEIKPPDWLPEELYGAFTILDFGQSDRLLKNDEFVFGANMAFRTAPLRQIGGFDENLGRVKTNLHGEEDLAVQRKLSSFGKGYYASRARVKHFVSKDRINWHWLVKRFAWQGFSEFLQRPRMQNFHLRALDAIDNNPLASQFYTGLFHEPKTKDDALNRLNLIRATLGNLFQGQENTVHIKDPIALNQQQPKPWEPQVYNALPITRLSSYVLSTIKPIFVEFGQSHSYLMKSFGDIGPFEFLNPQFDPWKNEFKAVTALRRMREELSCEKYKVFFITLDWLLFNKGAIQEIEKLPSCGILHRIYDNPISISNLKQLAAATQIVTFSQDVSDWVCATTGIVCPVLPHPPLFFKNTPTGEIPSRRMKHAQLQHVRKRNITLLGEIRTGKGFETVIKALGQNDAIRSNCVLIFGGGGEIEKVNEIISLARSARLEISLKINARQEHDFRGIDDIEFSNLIEDSDIMLFPYHGAEAHAMSGHFVDSIFAGCRVLVSDQSAMASLTETYKLGQVFDIHDGRSLCSKLMNELNRSDFSYDETNAVLAFQNYYATENCVRELSRIMKL